MASKRARPQYGELTVPGNHPTKRFRPFESSPHSSSSETQLADSDSNEDCSDQLPVEEKPKKPKEADDVLIRKLRETVEAFCKEGQAQRSRQATALKNIRKFQDERRKMREISKQQRQLTINQPAAPRRCAYCNLNAFAIGKVWDPQVSEISDQCLNMGGCVSGDN
ncbi:hypothetical protein F4819DRAFT_487182 [Hypoxylon fuscum]|nr:hypothetical protein F4819DRAFT_487182 [Hypoxylon fuscum]